MPPSGADTRPGGGRDACSLATPASLRLAFSCEGGNGSSLSVSVSESPAPLPLPLAGPLPAATAAPASAGLALLSRSTARALHGGCTPNVMWTETRALCVRECLLVHVLRLRGMHYAGWTTSTCARCCVCEQSISTIHTQVPRSFRQRTWRVRQTQEAYAHTLPPPLG